MSRRATMRILHKYEGNRDGLISILQEIQDQDGYLSPDALRTVADETGRSLVDIYGVATFYKSFSLKPRGRHIISVCTGTACHVRGANKVIQAFEKRLGIQASETTPDGQFTLETPNCLGACALGPIVVIDGRYFSKVSPREVDEILNEACGVVEEERKEACGAAPPLHARPKMAVAHATSDPL